MTYLELVKKAVQYSDTSSPSGFATVDESTDYVTTAADFVKEAWIRIQMRRDDWNWRLREFSMVTIPNKWEYDWMELRDRSDNRSIPTETGFRKWIGGEKDSYHRWMFFTPANDYASGTFFPFQRFEEFRHMRMMRNNIVSQPSRFTIAPDQKLQFYPIPDDRYQINGLFSRGVQILTDDNDEPYGIEAEYQYMIVWYAVMMLHDFDDAVNEARNAKKNFRRMMRSFERVHLPPIRIGAPLA